MKITLSKIRALCRDNSVDLSPFLWHVAKLEKPLAGGIEPGEIDSLPLEEKYCFSLVVGNLPPAVIKEEFGDDVLATAWAFYPPDDDPFGRREQLALGISKLTGMDLNTLEKARLTAWSLHSKRDTQTIFGNYELISGLSEFLKTKIDLGSLLTACVKKGSTLSEKRKADYRLEVICPLENAPKGYAQNREVVKAERDRKIFSFYIDSPIAVCLLYKDEPNAIAGISLKDGKTIFLPQIQGVEGFKIKGNEPIERVHSRGLAVLHWEKLLIHIVEEVGRIAGCESVCVQSANNNEWFKANTIVPIERGLRRYDENANSLGYKQSSDGNWYKSLTNLPN